MIQTECRRSAWTILEPSNPPDMHREDVVAAIRKTGLSCAALGRRHGLSNGAVSSALFRPWPQVEAIIAAHLGRPPSSIWPSRYDAAGRPLSGGWAYPSRRSGARHRQNGAAA